MKMVGQERTHPSDGDLIRFIDQELSHGEPTMVEAHVYACTHCEGRLREFQVIDGEWKRRFREAPVSVDQIARRRALAAVREAEAARRRSRARVERGRHRALAAAAVVLLVLGSLTVAPVRAWVAGRLGIGAPAATAPVASNLEGARSGTVVSFRPTAAEFRIDLEYLQTGGAVILVAAASDLASAEVLDRNTETLLLLPSGLMIENEPESSASYSVQIPPGRVGRVLVLAGGRVLAEVDVASFTDSPLTVPLRESRP